MNAPAIGKPRSTGFPAGVGFTPVPNPLLADLLEEIDDAVELRLTLRLVWLIHRKRGFPKWSTVREVCGDRTVARVLGATGSELERVAAAKLERAVGRGTFLRTGSGGDERIYLNTAENRRELVRRGQVTDTTMPGPSPEAWSATGLAQPLAGAFPAYEENIGPLTPVVIARIEEALRDHPEEQVIAAIQAAVEANVRNWNYISAVLKSHSPGEGGQRGQARRYPDAAREDEFIRKYVERQRARGRR